MSDKFPHLADSQYPNLANSNVWQYENNFDFSKFDDMQMHIKICSVPWDLGEVHVGLASIPMGNVIGWESKEQRDNYLDSLDGIEFDTHYRCYHDNETIKLPLPYEYMALHNYIIVDYSKPPVEFADGSGISRFLFFIRDLKQLSINTTQCEIKRDTWSMFINDIDFSYLQFERGHYPVAKSASVDEYLQAPVKNNDYLLTPDVSYGEPMKPNEIGYLIENDEDCYYVIACTSAPYLDSWGSEDAAKENPESTKPWNTPACGNTHTEQNSPAYFCFAINNNKISDFWSNVREQAPQFVQTVVAVYLISKSLVSIQEESKFTFCGITGFQLGHSHDVKNLGIAITKDMFGYDSSISDMTKLYTSPYCHIEITDGEGQTAKIMLENISSNQLKAIRHLSIAYPYCNVKTYLYGIGNGESKTVKYMQLEERNFKYAGKWWDYIWSHDIPTYGIFEAAYKNNDYTQWFNRYAAKTNANRSAETGEANTKRLNKASVAATKASSETSKQLTDNVNGSGGLNLALVAEANAQLDANFDQDSELTNKNTFYSSRMTLEMANSEAQASLQSASISANATTQTAANTANAEQTTAVINGVAGVASGAVSGAGAAGGVGAATGALSGVISGVAGFASATVSADTTRVNASIQSTAVTSTANVSANLTNTKAQKTTEYNELNRAVAVDVMEEKKNITKSYNSTVAKLNNANAIKATSLQASTANTNAENMSSAGNTNAEKTAQAQKDNISTSNTASRNSSALQAPLVHGQFTNGEWQAVKPRGLWANIVTQTKDAITQAGSEFKRYGYYWDGNVKFETFNVMSKFSYWKVRDIWASAKNLPDAWVDEIRNFLLKGVTVWAKPEYINATSIYENEKAE